MADKTLPLKLAETGYLTIPNPGIEVFKFESHEIRMHLQADQALFVANDVCAALEIASVANALRNLDPAAMLIVTVQTAAGPRKVNALTEGGLYELVMKSKTAAALKFKRWVCYDLLPILRKKGHFNENPAALVATRKHFQQIEYAEKVALRKDFQFYKERFESGHYDAKGWSDSDTYAYAMIKRDLDYAQGRQAARRAEATAIYGELAHCVVPYEPEDLKPW